MSPSANDSKPELITVTENSIVQIEKRTIKI